MAKSYSFDGFVNEIYKNDNNYRLNISIVYNPRNFAGKQLDEVVSIALSNSQYDLSRPIQKNNYISIIFSESWKIVNYTIKTQISALERSINIVAFPPVLPNCGKVNIAIIAAADCVRTGCESSGYIDAIYELAHHPLINFIPYKIKITSEDAIINALREIEKKDDIHVVAISKGGTNDHQAFNSLKVCYHFNRIKGKAKYTGIGHKNSHYLGINDFVNDKFGSPTALSIGLTELINRIQLISSPRLENMLVDTNDTPHIATSSRSIFSKIKSLFQISN